VVPTLPVSSPISKFSTWFFPHFLELGEQVEADEGYRDHADKIKCPGIDSNPAEKWVM